MVFRVSRSRTSFRSATTSHRIGTNYAAVLPKTIEIKTI